MAAANLQAAIGADERASARPGILQVSDYSGMWNRPRWLPARLRAVLLYMLQRVVNYKPLGGGGRQ